MVSWILEGIRRAFWILLDTVVGWLMPFFILVLEALPFGLKTKVAENLASLQTMLAFADYWFPMVEVFGMLLLYWTFVIFWSGLKIVIKMIPFVG